ncbi:MAG: DASS family sodium-coupled anion symporter [Gammaproteobacteria bacterium]|jgi:sodium-dependent dicarboxylate transporter 2/3/5
MTARNLALFGGPLILALFLWLPVPAGLSEPGWQMLGVAAWMALWWISEAIPIPATALLPIVAFPVLGIMPAARVTEAYANHLIYLFLGGFMIAVTMERWNLHRRVALNIIHRVGTSPARLVLGFMLATAFLSMWISNTATAMLMVTIGMAVLKQLLPDGEFTDSPLSTALMLGIAYAASIGGVATLIGTPPNAVLAGVLDRNYGIDLSFGAWMRFALPLSVVMLAAAWVYLTRVAFPMRDVQCYESAAQIDRELRQLGRAGTAEKRVALIFSGVALLWTGRGLIDWAPLQAVRDSTIAIAGALLLFIVPAGGAQRVALLDWSTAVRIPWDIIVLFGGGFALAAGFSETGLTTWLAEQLRVLAGVPVPLIILGVGALVIFLTEMTSNTATASLMLPVLGALAEALSLPPPLLMVTATICASYAFMLPVATPPNAIVFGSRCVSIRQMAGAGLWLNLIGLLLIGAFVYLWGVVFPAPHGVFSL